jgi:hypothetical protein
MQDFHDAYSLSLEEALLPLVFFAPSIELARQSLQRYLTQHYCWQHALREKLGAAAQALPDVKCALVCSDDTPFADTGAVLLLCASDVETRLLPLAHGNPNEKVRGRVHTGCFGFSFNSKAAYESCASGLLTELRSSHSFSK